MPLSQKQETLLSLALESTPEERQQSQILNVGVDEAANRWEIIVKYHGNLERIADEDIEVELLIAGYAIVTLPGNMVESLAALEEVEYMEKPKSFITGLYEAKENSCISYGIQTGEELTGRGVLLAVIDSGIDFLLPDFQNEQGSRIVYLWEQSLEPDASRGWYSPEGFRVGVELSREMLNQAIEEAAGENSQQNRLFHQDNSGHGTGVAAIAASSNSELLLRGVAPGCELLIVKLKNTAESDYPGTTELMRAITYAIRKAQELGKPLVINLSYGNSYGSHDGTSLIERFLDNASEIGRTVICVGSGNEGAGLGHVAGNIRELSNVELGIAEREFTTNVQLWKNYEDEFGVRLTAPNGEEYEVDMQNVEVGRASRKQEIILGNTKVLIYVGMPTPYSSQQELFFVFLPISVYIDSGIWSWKLLPKKIVDGNYQMYLPSARQRNIGTGFFQPNPNLTMTIPATASRVISVAAYNDTLDSYADFSGRGRQFGGFTYLAAEGNKPDLAAPGVGLIAARAGGSTDSYTGTSFATPMVAGSAALLMEWGIVRGNDPYLYGEKVKAYLRRGAQPIRGEREYPNNKVGWGEDVIIRLH